MTLITPTPPPPDSEHELLERAHALAGHTLGELAQRHGLAPPRSPQQAKGWAGQVVETGLGASAASRPQPDFPALHVELKTLPLNAQHQPKESTYVCTVPMQPQPLQCWEEAWVCRKLQRVLWLPVEAHSDTPLTERRIGMAILWSPSAAQAAILRQDWEELIELVSLGRWSEISARQGHYLQIRPKAANAQSLCPAFDEEGRAIMTLPRGFYLRPRLTAEILALHYA